MPAFFINLFIPLIFSFFYLVYPSISYNANPIEFIVNAKPPQAINNSTTPINLSCGVYGLISP